MKVRSVTGKPVFLGGITVGVSLIAVLVLLSGGQQDTASEAGQHGSYSSTDVQISTGVQVAVSTAVSTTAVQSPTTVPAIATDTPRPIPTAAFSNPPWLDPPIYATQEARGVAHLSPMPKNNRYDGPQVSTSPPDTRAEVHPAPRPKHGYSPPASGGNDSRDIGILEGGEFFRPGQAHIENRWQDYVNGVFTTVYAGAFADDPQQGFVYVLKDLPDGNIDGAMYPTPAKAGELRITVKNGLRFILAAGGGRTFTFDLATRTFVGG